MNRSRQDSSEPAQGAEYGDGGNRTHATFPAGSSLRRTAKPRRRASFAASPDQRAKVNGCVCVVCSNEPVDPAHLCARAQGGCGDPLCVVPLCRLCHTAFDTGNLDLLPFLVRHYTLELQHALGHYRGDLISLLHRLTGERYAPVVKQAA